MDVTYCGQVKTVAGRGVIVDNMRDAMAMADAMAISVEAVPKHCRGSKGLCLAITLQALRLGMDPFALASKTYVVNDRLAYEAQLVHSIVQTNAPLNGRLRHKYLGEGEQRQCVVTGYLSGEEEPFVFTSPKVKDISPKNSPLWKSNQDLQLWYFSVRSWARMFVPDVILGMYSKDEIEDSAPAASSSRPPRTAAEAMQRATAPRTVVTQVAPPPPPPVGVPGDSPAMAAWRSSIDAEAAAGRDVSRWAIPATLTEEEFEEAVTYRDILTAAREAAKGDAS